MFRGGVDAAKVITTSFVSSFANVTSIDFGSYPSFMAIIVTLPAGTFWNVATPLISSVWDFTAFTATSAFFILTFWVSKTLTIIIPISKGVVDFGVSIMSGAFAVCNEDWTKTFAVLS